MKHNTRYVIATVVNTINRLISSRQDRESIEKIMRRMLKKGMISFGERTKLKNNHPETQIEYFRDILSSSIPESVLNEMDLYIDSGGYQLSIGKIPYKYIDTYIDAYIRYLDQYRDEYDYAFSLDIPSLPVGSDKSLYELNKYTTDRILEFPEDIKKKIYYVCHFTNFDRYTSWNKLIIEHKILDHFVNFSIGGVAAKLNKTMKNLQFYIYIFGICQILLGIKELPKEIKIHILGVGTPTSIFFFLLLEELLKRKLNIDITFTFDSSSPLQKVILSRVISHFDEENEIVYDVSIKSNALKRKYPNGMTAYDILMNYIQQITSETNYYIHKDIYRNGTLDSSIYGVIPFIEVIYLRKTIDYMLAKIPHIMDQYYKDSFDFYLLVDDFLNRMGGESFRDRSDKSRSLISFFHQIENLLEKRDMSLIEQLFESYRNILDVG